MIGPRSGPFVELSIVKIAVAAFALLAFPTLALAQGAPRKIDDCERIGEALAYNACLAKFGPERAGGGPMVTPEQADDLPPGKSAKAGRRSSTRSASYRRGVYTTRARHGRVRAEFSLKR